MAFGGRVRIDLHARVRTSDGDEAGNIRRVLVDPKAGRITGFVVSTGRLLGREVIVGEDAFAAPGPEGDITLQLTKRELDAQPTFEETAHVVPPTGWAAPNFGYTIPPDAFLWPADAATGGVPAARSRPAIEKGDTVKDRDGDVVGTIQDIQFDERTGEVSSFIVKLGAGLERLFGGEKVAEIGRQDILRIAEGEVRLGVDREEIVPREYETGTR